MGTAMSKLAPGTKYDAKQQAFIDMLDARLFEETGETFNLPSVPGIKWELFLKMKGEQRITLNFDSELDWCLTDANPTWKIILHKWRSPFGSAYAVTINGENPVSL